MLLIRAEACQPHVTDNPVLRTLHNPDIVRTQRRPLPVRFAYPHVPGGSVEARRHRTVRNSRHPSET
jgi:hypothetical protein